MTTPRGSLGLELRQGGHRDAEGDRELQSLCSPCPGASMTGRVLHMVTLCTDLSIYIYIYI